MEVEGIFQYTVSIILTKIGFVMTAREHFLQEQKNKLIKAIGHLDYSYSKVLQLHTELDKLDEETLETWESFAARFSRVADVFLMKYLRACVLLEDPGFNGTFRDMLHQGEKLSIVDNTDLWMAIRELRNISAHEYTDKDLSAFFKRLREEAPRLIALKHSI